MLHMSYTTSEVVHASQRPFGERTVHVHVHPIASVRYVGIVALREVAHNLISKRRKMQARILTGTPCGERIPQRMRQRAFSDAGGPLSRLVSGRHHYCRLIAQAILCHMRGLDAHHSALHRLASSSSSTFLQPFGLMPLYALQTSLSSSSESLDTVPSTTTHGT